MKQLKLIFLISLISFTGISQIEISGLIKDTNGPVSFASIVLKDSINTIKTYDITDQIGSFILETDKGSYTLEINILGYKELKKQIVIENSQVLEDIFLEPSTEQLDEVVIKNRKRLIERKPDRLIFNVENSIAASGGNALDALRVAPGVTVENDAISMIGRGASRVMVDGRMLQLSGEELVTFLNSIVASEIKKIEVITNPPAKYEAAGSGGLINIIYKKGVRNSWKNSTTVAYNQNTYNFFNVANNFLYSKNKVKLGLSVNGNIGAIREIEDFITKYPNGPWDARIKAKQQKDNLSGRISLDYDVSKMISIGAQYLGNFNRPDRKDKTITNIFNSTNRLDSIFDSSGKNESEINSHLYNFHLISKIDTLGRRVSFDFDYFDYDNKLKRDYIVNTLSPDDNFLNINQAAINSSNQRIDNFSGKVDIEHPFESINLSYGAKLSFIKTVNDLVSLNTITGEPVFDPILSNEFEYKEDVQALYLNASKEIKKKWRMQVGLRVENTITEGFSKTLDQTNKNDYLKLFPTFYIAYQKNENNDFSFNYGRRIKRPSFRILNPFRTFTNSSTYSEGNPFIQPSFTDSFEFNYTHKEVLTTNIFFSTTSNGFGTVFTADKENNIQAVIRRNYYTGYKGGIGEIYTFNKISWWESQNQVFLIGYKSDFDIDLDAEPKNGFQLYLDTYNTFSLSQSTKLQVDLFYSSPYKDRLLDYGERYGLDIGIKQGFFKNNLRLSLYVKDIFDTGSMNNIVSEVDDVEVNYSSNYSRRFFRFSLSYNFGNRKIRVRDRKFGNDEETKRAN
ncbi:outer membrane beta-barrel protein [Aquimarina muelleri]|uniref:outer membrane beta-barrel protein n=1 Tax=Aquimarina muelleri TaxID=279356 RepID=UPI003F686249